MTTRIVMTLAIGWCLAGTMRASAQTYTFTTLAGETGYGYADGSLSEARFWQPQGITIDGAGNIYVSEGTESAGSQTIRRISTTGVVSTVAGLLLRSGHADGVGTSAQFWWPGAIVADGQGTLYRSSTVRIR